MLDVQYLAEVLVSGLTIVFIGHKVSATASPSYGYVKLLIRMHDSISCPCGEGFHHWV